MLVKCKKNNAQVTMHEDNYHHKFKSKKSISFIASNKKYLQKINIQSRNFMYILIVKHLILKISPVTEKNIKNFQKCL